MNDRLGAMVSGILALSMGMALQEVRAQAVAKLDGDAVQAENANVRMRLRCPIWISLGLFDDVTPSMGVFCAWNAIPGEKQIKVCPLGGHNSSSWDYNTATKGVWP